MKALVRLLLALCTVATPLAALAQGCPPGQYPVAGQGWNYCAPVPGAEQNEAPPQQPAGPRWKDVWQATAIDNDKGALGTATSRSTEKSAISGALMDCEDKGGTHCEIQITEVNGCVAMVVGEKVLNTKDGPTEREAIRRATAQCNAKNSTCRVYYSHCNFAERIQ